MELEEGRLLGHYRLIRKIGQGGMGEVWAAADTRLEREVALKVLPADFASDPERQSRFEREAKAVAALNHPNIVTIHSVEQIEGTHFITMELVSGRQLSELIPAEGMATEGLLELAIPLADAVAAAHERGITHRDLKPENVMVDDKGRVKVLDFGLAKLRDEEQPAVDGVDHNADTITREGLIVGTVAYMSPEQAEGKSVDPRSDVFSLGIVLYVMATGRRPFTGDTSVSTLSSILKDSPPTVSEIKPTLPRELARIVERALAKQPSGRFQSALGLHRELVALGKELASGQIATGTTTSGAAAAVSRRSPVGRIAALAIGIGAIVLTAAFFWNRMGDNGDASVSPPPSPTEASLAVLPFTNMSADPANEYFSDGMTEEIITRLSKLSSLRVMSRGATFRYKGLSRDPREVGRELGVTSILEGSVRREGDQVRIHANLINVEDGFHVWTDSYDGKTDAIFALQDEVAGEIAGALRLTLGEADHQAIRTRATDNVEAYDSYVQARHEFYRYTPEGHATAIKLYEQALALDPEYALALAGLSLCQSQYANRGWSNDPAWLDRAEQSARRAIELDPGLAEAHFALGFAFEQRSMFEQMLEAMQRALELNPNHAHAHDSLADVYVQAGRPDAALTEFEIALSLDPFLVPALLNSARTLLAQGRHGEGLARTRRLLEAHPDLGWGELILGRFYTDHQQFDEAVTHLERSRELDPKSVGTMLALARARIGLGDLAAARALAEVLSTASPEISASIARSVVLGQIELAEENPDGALRRFLEADEIAQRLNETKWGFLGGDAHITALAEAYLALDRPDQAAEQFLRVLEVDAGRTIYHFHRGRALEAAGQTAEAIREYGTFLDAWKKADPGTPEVAEAEERLANLIGGGGR